MKKHILFIFVFAAGMATTAILSWKKNPESNAKEQRSAATVNPDHNPVIALRKIKLKAGVSEQALEALAKKMKDGTYGKMPGVKQYLAKGDRGDDVGHYIYVMEFDSKITRDFYFPVEGEDTTKTSPEARKFMVPTGQMYTDFLKIAEQEGDVKADAKGYTDYVMLQ